MHSLIEQYQAKINSGELQVDDAQKRAILALDEVADRLVKNSKRGLFFSFRSKLVKGLYFYGGVGRGKTMMMDLFFNSIPEVKRRRQHFNRFMEDVHARLNSHQGAKDPLVILSDEIAREIDVLCFDEFFVEDIADAMVLGVLVELLFKKGVCLVATSNRAPKDLYKEGLKRDRFLPAIQALEANTTILNVDSGVDYREESTHAHYFYPLEGADRWMQAKFDRIAHGSTVLSGAVFIRNRQIQTVAHSSDMVWFDFKQICQTRRAKADYIEIADHFKTVFISNVPQMDASKDDAARRFVALVDELYDNEVTCFISAEVKPESLYIGQRHAFIFQRTASRISA